MNAPAPEMPIPLDHARPIVEGRALADVIAERIAQARSHGHDPEADAMLPLDELPRKAGEYLMIAKDVIRGSLAERDLPRARKKLVQSCALLLAAIDRLDRVRA